jgi:hypothetical protein
MDSIWIHSQWVRVGESAREKRGRESRRERREGGKREKRGRESRRESACMHVHT